jgi:tRNA(Ile)-lysidine synthase
MLLLAEDLVERVRKIIPRYSMLAPGDRVGVAVSGGADSVVLLHILHRLISEFAIHLTVLHVNHCLRGNESDEDEQFVREMAGTFGLQFIGTRKAPGPGNLEQEARRARREFFRTCREQHGIQKIALGHTRSDQAETVLYRFLRGSGTAGLAGMRAVTEDGLIRPLLDSSRTEVRAWAAREGILWREDSSNANEGFARNLLRNQVMPALTRDFNPNLEGILAGTAEVAAAEEAYWNEQIEPICRKILRRCDLGVVLPVNEIAGKDRAVQRRLVRRAVEELRGDLRSIDLRHIDAITELCHSQQGHDRVLIPGVDAMRSFGVLLLARPGELNASPRNYCVDITWDKRVELPFGAGIFELVTLNSNSQNCVNFKEESQFPNREVADLDFDALMGQGTATRLQVRNWRPGDELLRAGHQRPEKIKSLFQEFQVLLWRRRHWPVAVANEEIVWARGFGAAARYLAKAETRRVLRICYRANDDAREL